jgi:hypothetical protein
MSGPKTGTQKQEKKIFVEDIVKTGILLKNVFTWPHPSCSLGKMSHSRLHSQTFP